MREVKSVSFCIKDRFEHDLYHHALQQGKFSKYIKRLIERDMQKERKGEKNGVGSMG